MGKIPGYLGAALKALTLHTEARTVPLSSRMHPFFFHPPIKLTR